MLKSCLKLKVGPEYEIWLRVVHHNRTIVSKMVYYVLRRGGEVVKLLSKWCYVINEQPLSRLDWNLHLKKVRLYHDPIETCFGYVE